MPKLLTSYAAVPPPSRLYWRCQLIGWTFYAGFNLMVFSMFGRFSLDGVFISAIIALTLLGLSHGLRYHIRARGWTQLGPAPLLGRLLLTNLLLALFSQVIIWGLIAGVVRPASTGQSYGVGQFIGYVFNVNFLLWLWSGFYFGWFYLQRYRQAEIDKWKLTAAVREAEMQTLKAQINPHFLFNGLNNIRSLIGEDPERARHMLSHLSELLRYAIQLNRTEQVPLGRELAVVRDYLQLESLQLEERLRYAIDVPADCLPVLVPPMLVQVLVENAVKHGLAPLPAGGELRIGARRTPQELLLTVANTGQLTPHPTAPRPDGTGTGLRNVRERLRLLFGPQAELRLEQADAATVAATVRLPLGNEPLALGTDHLPLPAAAVPGAPAPASC
ncbi:sensor histidine kinase [Hymenobacter edaphi]|uniref:Histidine kinase n=1 Tax=Hymenobacter edaphi TaxID=2211146 RepID=A0A328BHL3_9BACT|nr:histidine kinase [Hymenobacter edaphi]RAK66145.1 histidine kinase [Hymenobacter edaphi]